MNKLDIKGLSWYVFISYLGTIIIAIILRIKNIHLNEPEFAAYRSILISVMIFPAIAALIVRKFITKEGFQDSYLKWGNKKAYLKAAIFIPLLYLIVYALTSVIYKPDFSLNSFMAEMNLPALPMPSGIFILLIFLFTLTLSPILNFIPSFGEELGWRGYLLPKLLPLGRKKALVISSFIWACWHLPLILLIGFGGYSNSILGGVIYVVVITCFGIYLGSETLKNRSVFLASFIHGVFNAQAYGIWPILFINANALFGGILGLIAIVVFVPLALFYLYKS